jgi:hypothetical protein
MTLAAAVLDALQSVDSDWELIPVDDRKRPVDPVTGHPRNDWASNTYDLEGLTAVAVSRFVRAVGVVLGPPSGGLLAVDFDGEQAPAVFRAIYGRDARSLPRTVGWTSGRQARAQLAFRVPRDLWPLLRGRRRWLDSNGQTVLELRWVGHQSVIAGAHPDTAGYSWLPLRSPEDVSTADAPDWLLEPLFKAPDEPIQAEYTPTAADVDRALGLLQHIKPRDDYDSWLRIGMALHAVDPGLLSDWVGWSRGCSNFDEAECLAKWSSFKGGGVTIGTLYWFAEQDGYTRPRLSPVELLERSATLAAHADDEYPGTDEDGQHAREQLAGQLHNLRADLDLGAVLPPRLAKTLIERAAAFPVHPTALLGPLLTTAASVLGTRVVAVVNKAWSEPLAIWAGNILPPSALKTPVAKVFESPLLDLQEASFKAHRDAIARKAPDEPDPPPARRLLVMDSTYERIAQILAEPGTVGLLSLQDELGGWFERLDASSSAGARAGWLSLWSGSAAMVDRKVAASSFARRTAVSLFGNVQPDRLLAMINNGGDDAAAAGDGLWARFLWCRPPQIPWRYNPGGESIHLQVLNLLRTLDTAPHGSDARGHGLQVRFPHEVVQELAAPQWEAWADQAATASNDSRAAFLGKLRGYSVRLASLVLLLDLAESAGLFGHTLQQVAQVDRLTGQWFVEMPAAALAAGLTMAEFYLDQFDALQPELGGTDLPADVARFLRKVEELQIEEVTPRTLLGWRMRGRDRMTTAEALDFLRTVATRYGFGNVKPGKRRDSWVWVRCAEPQNGAAEEC